MNCQQLHAIDFAGGTAVHINSGAAGLALALVLGKRKSWPTTLFRPHNLPFVMLGAGLLWFGWYGFNAGSATSSNGAAGSTFITTTTIATAAAMLAWRLAHRAHPRRPRHDAGSGVGHRRRGWSPFTLSCSSVNALGALIVGLVAGVVCALAVGLKFKLGFDDSLDVVGVHLVGGLVGTLLLGLLAAPDGLAINGVSGVSKGLLYGGGWEQLEKQAVGAFAVLGYSFIATTILALILTTILALILKYTIGLRLNAEAEASGIDEAEHAESGYDFAVSTASVLSRASLPNAQDEIASGASDLVLRGVRYCTRAAPCTRLSCAMRGWICTSRG
nr:hypothetical protein [Mycobacterium tilburgii]